MSLQDFIREMPKVENHVHLEGATQPATLLQLAAKHGVDLPADTVEGIQEWYTFRDFSHFIEIYQQISDCIRIPDDIELLAWEFLKGQAEQNIHYSEVTYTPFLHYDQHNIPFEDQLAALNRARSRAVEELNINMGIVIDIPRMIDLEGGILTANWAISGYGDGVVAFGLGGPEVGHPPEKFTEAFAKTNAAGLPSVPHAGETEGPRSIWGAIQHLDAVRIGHGVRCIEDPMLVRELRDRQIPLEVNPTSNICLGVFNSFDEHPLPRMIDEGLYVTLNSDDPPMFNTTLTDEYLKTADSFGFDADRIEWLMMNALRATFLPDEEKAQMIAAFEEKFEVLREKHLEN